MNFYSLFEGKSLPAVRERVGVMSIDSLNRQWELVFEESGYLIAKSKDGKAALLGRMSMRDDGKFCVEVVVRAAIENNEIRHCELWATDPADERRYARRFSEVMRSHLDRQ